MPDVIRLVILTFSDILRTYRRMHSVKTKLSVTRLDCLRLVCSFLWSAFEYTAKQPASKARMMYGSMSISSGLRSSNETPSGVFT